MNASRTSATHTEAPSAATGQPLCVARKLFTGKLFTRSVREEARLDAPAGEVWHWLTHFESFARWNPFFRKVEGELGAGSRLKVRARLGERLITFRPVITEVDPARELRWTTRVLVPGLFDVDRRFILDGAGSQQTTFIQDETSSGLLVPLAFALAHMERDLRAGFRDLSQALALQTAAVRRRASLRSDVRALQRGRTELDENAPNSAVQH